MPSHRAEGAPSGRLRLVGLLAALLVIVGVVGVFISRQSSRTSTQTTATIAGSSSSPTTASPASPLDSSSVAASPTSSSSSSSSGATGTAGASAAATKAWAACTAQLEAGSALLDATDASAKSWQTHYGAQISFDQHEISRDKTLALFASSKAQGFAEVKSYDAAAAAYKAKASGCDGLAEAVGADQSDASAVCMAQAKAQDAAISAGSKVEDQWAGHMHKMVSTMYHGSTAYLGAWHKLVRAAPPVTSAWNDARSTYHQTPACSPPKA